MPDAELIELQDSHWGSLIWKQYLLIDVEIQRASFLLSLYRNSFFSMIDGACRNFGLQKENRSAIAPREN
jgi:hypothetical protein